MSEKLFLLHYVRTMLWSQAQLEHLYVKITAGSCLDLKHSWTKLGSGSGLGLDHSWIEYGSYNPRSYLGLTRTLIILGLDHSWTMLWVSVAA